MAPVPLFFFFFLLISQNFIISLLAVLVKYSCLFKKIYAAKGLKALVAVADRLTIPVRTGTLYLIYRKK